MKKAFLLLIALLTTVCSALWAEPISESQARSIAASFMASRAKQLTPLRKARKAPKNTADSTATAAAAYYVFNADEGYVIVAGDDRAPAVLGYSDEGTFVDDDVPVAMQALLDGYAAQITALEQGATSTALRTSGAAITPLLKTQWNQDSPYNKLMPSLPSGEQAVTGCVATALAQVMAFWKWPACPTRKLPEYTSETLLIHMPELPVVDFRWDILQNNYLKTDTESDAARAAATLNLYCAQAMQMDFKTESSGANTSAIPSTAHTFFDYDADAHFEARLNYSTQEWADLIYGELEAGRPVIYSGSKKSGGHAFVCDGYDGSGLFHINWGWNGQGNGYFLLNVLNPDEQGTGSASGAYGYVLSQSALVGFQPNKGSSNRLEISSVNFVVNSYVDTRESTGDNFSVNVTGEFHNSTSDTLAVRYGWGLYDESGNFVERLISYYNDVFRPGRYSTLRNLQLNLGAGRTDGIFRIVPMYCENGTSNWRPCVGGERNYVEVTIDGLHCTFTGHGTTGVRDYTVNNILTSGNLYNGRPVNIDVNITNNGQANNQYLHMFVDDKFSGTALVTVEPGATGDIIYPYLTADAGSHTFKWSWNDDGSNPITSSTITFSQMPAASLSASCQVLDVTDATNKVITSTTFSVALTVTNIGSTTYDDDILAELYKHTHGTTGSRVQGSRQRLTLAPGESTTLQFDMTDVCDAWKYFIYFSYFSEGRKVEFAKTPNYTIAFPVEPAPFLRGNVKIRNIADDEGTSYVLGDSFNIRLTLLNEGTAAYDDDVTAVLFERRGTSNIEVQRVSRHLTLEAGEYTTMAFDLTDVVDGRTYHVYSYFYLKGEQTLLVDARTSNYLVLQTPPPPSANLDAIAFITDMAFDDDGNKVVASDTFSVELVITNKDNKPYDNDIVVKLFEGSEPGSGTEVQSVSQHLTLAADPDQPVTMQFDMTDVIDGRQYYAQAYYYNRGELTPLTLTQSLPMLFPIILGDVNGDSEITIADVTALVNIILGKDTTGYSLRAADVNKDGETTIADVTALVNIILGK